MAIYICTRERPSRKYNPIYLLFTELFTPRGGLVDSRSPKYANRKNKQEIWFGPPTVTNVYDTLRRESDSTEASEDNSDEWSEESVDNRYERKESTTSTDTSSDESEELPDRPAG